ICLRYLRRGDLLLESSLSLLPISCLLSIALVPTIKRCFLCPRCQDFDICIDSLSRLLSLVAALFFAVVISIPCSVVGRVFLVAIVLFLKSKSCHVNAKHSPTLIPE